MTTDELYILTTLSQLLLVVISWFLLLTCQTPCLMEVKIKKGVDTVHFNDREFICCSSLPLTLIFQLATLPSLIYFFLKSTFLLRRIYWNHSSAASTKILGNLFNILVVVCFFLKRANVYIICTMINDIVMSTDVLLVNVYFYQMVIFSTINKNLYTLLSV